MAEFLGVADIGKSRGEREVEEKEEDEGEKEECDEKEKEEEEEEEEEAAVHGVGSPVLIEHQFR